MKVITSETKMKIAYDYLRTSLQVKEIAKKFDVSDTTVRQAHLSFDKKVFEPKKDTIVIKIERHDMRALEALLKEFDFSYEVPEHFELIEKFESKINKQ